MEEKNTISFLSSFTVWNLKIVTAFRLSDLTKKRRSTGHGATGAPTFTFNVATIYFYRFTLLLLYFI